MLELAEAFEASGRQREFVRTVEEALRNARGARESVRVRLQTAKERLAAVVTGEVVEPKKRDTRLYRTF